jgi:hypothetical protein
VTYHEETLLGTFDQPSPYRGKPTPELDWMWEDIVEGSAFNYPEDKLSLLNISDSERPNYLHTEAQFGGGVASPAWGFHQLHCLVSLLEDTRKLMLTKRLLQNVLRQVSYIHEYEKQGRLPRILREEESYRRDHVGMFSPIT